MKAIKLIILFFFTLYAVSSFGQVDTAHLVVEAYCPGAYPIIGDSIDVVVKVTNDGGMTSEAKPLYFYQRNFSYPNYNAVIYLGEPFDVPVLGVNESITLTKRFPTGEFPGFYHPNGEYGSVGKEVLEYGFAFYKGMLWWMPPTTEASLDFYCKKYDTDLAIEITSLDTTYDESGIINYKVEFTNNGSETAYNVVANLKDNLGQFSIYYSALDYISISQDDSLVVFAPVSGNVSVKVNIDSLEVGATKSVDVTYLYPIFDFPPSAFYSWHDYHRSLPVQQTVTVIISSGHNINTMVENDSSSLVFTYNSHGCSSIQDYSQIDTFGGHGYYLSNDMATWVSANTLAQNAGGYLAAITIQEENDLIQSGLDTLQAFIGLTDQSVEGVVQWSDGEPVTIDLSYGNSAENDYGLMNYWSGEWQMVNAQIEKHWILEKDCVKSTCPDELQLKDQADVDYFSLVYPDCKHIAKSVIIRYNVHSLEGLSNLESIGADLVISSCHSLVNLDGLENLSSVGGKVVLEYDEQLQDLDGLEMPYIGELFINGCDALVSLSGLENLLSVGQLGIGGNDGLLSLGGLENLYSADRLGIGENPKLVSLEGLDSLRSVGKFYVGKNDSLVDLSGLEEIDSIGQMRLYNNKHLANLSGMTLSSIDEILIERCDTLVDLSGLEGFKKIGKLEMLKNKQLHDLTGLDSLQSLGELVIEKCNSLVNLVGLENLDSLGMVNLLENKELSSFTTLDLTSIGGIEISKCNNFINFEGLENIETIVESIKLSKNKRFQNFKGLENLHSIGQALRVSRCDSIVDFEDLVNLDSIGYILSLWDNKQLHDLHDLSDLHSLDVLSIGQCESLVDLQGFENLDSMGGVNIDENIRLQNLNGLENLQYIGNYLHIGRCDSLVNLVGLENVEFVGDWLSIKNNKRLFDMTGLNQLKTINGYFIIENNNKLKKLDGLENLINMNGYLRILDNDVLSNIEGLMNIDPNDILSSTSAPDLYIQNNPMLSKCEIMSICGLLDLPRSEHIQNNAVGCNSKTEVQDACDALVANDELNLETITIYPSLAMDNIIITWGDTNKPNGIVTIFDARGQVLLSNSFRQGSTQMEIDVSNFPQGMYFLKVGESTDIQRFVKMD